LKEEWTIANVVELAASRWHARGQEFESPYLHEQVLIPNGELFSLEFGNALRIVDGSVETTRPFHYPLVRWAKSVARIKLVGVSG
jgi:hypothetical protein